MSEVSTRPFVFISYSHADGECVTRLKTDLQDQGVNIWIDQEGLQPGTRDWEEALRMAIRGAYAVLLIASPKARSSLYVKDELRIAEMYNLAVYAVWVVGTQWIDAVPMGWGGVQYFDAREPRYQRALREIVTVLSKPLSQTSSMPPEAPEPDFEPRNPYKGLRAFTSADTHDFFGRERLIKELADALKEILIAEKKSKQSTRLLAVVGPSGSGKSSVMMAALVPRLQAGELAGSKEWIYLGPILPGVHPIESLTLALSEKLPDRSLKAIREDLEDESARGLHLLATSLAKKQETKVVLFVDQFEELFTQTTAEEERQRFIHLLVTAITEPDGPVMVILTLRADFSDRPMHYPELGKLIEAHRKPVLPMELKDLRAVIEEPAKLPDVQLTFEGNLVGDLLFDMQGQAGALPLLQFTLDQLYQRRRGHQLTPSAYREIGGIKGALAKHAESTYNSLPSYEHCQLARVLFLRLMDPGQTEQDTTRRRAALAELSLPDPTKTIILRETANAFIRARLLTTNEIAGITTIEISHEALIREWVRLADWLLTSRSDVLQQKAISEDTAEWIRRGRPSDRLYRGTQLVEAQAWAARSSSMPSREERDFLEASVAERDRQQAEERARQTREMVLQDRAKKRQRWVIVLLAVISVLLVLGSVGTLIFQGNLLTAQSKLLDSLPVSVTNLNDHGPASLREAIKNAHSGDEITFARNLGGTILLTSGELKITTDLAIIGPGASILTISARNTSRVFYVNGGLNVTISNLTIKDGHTGPQSNEFSQDKGGGIYNDFLSTLALINVIITANSADFGGGIYNDLGTMTLINTTVSSNIVVGDGGGIENHGTMTLTNSTVSGNTATQDGGGIKNRDLLSLTNSTISGNTASGNIATTGYGGGILNDGGVIDITYCTIYGNTAQAGGGIANKTTNEPGIEMIASIVAGDNANSDPDILGIITLYWPSLIQNASGTIFFSGPVPQELQVAFELSKHSIIGKSPNVGPLQNNGGLTQTHALLPGSPAIDQILPNDTDQLCGSNASNSTDQRGFKRPQGSACDLGAYEYVLPKGL